LKKFGFGGGLGKKNPFFKKMAFYGFEKPLFPFFFPGKPFFFFFKEKEKPLLKKKTFFKNHSFFLFLKPNQTTGKRREKGKKKEEEKKKKMEKNSFLGKVFKVLPLFFSFF